MFLPSVVQTIQHFCSAMKGLFFKINLALIAVLSFFIIILIWQIARNGPLLNLEALSKVILQQSSEKRSPWDAGRPLLKPLFSSRLETLEEACRKMDKLKRVILLTKYIEHFALHHSKIPIQPNQVHTAMHSKMTFLNAGEADATQVECQSGA